MATTNGGPLRAPDTTVVFTPSTITVAVGETATINYSSGTAAPSASTLDTLFGGIATTEVDGGGMVGTIVISGVSAGTVSIAPSTPLGNGATMSQDGFTLTVTAPVDDDKFLNKRGLTHFWENIDDIKQDKLTAGANITIASDNTISASQPTVNNATLTIQKEGASVGTFTANASANSTVNIIETDPTVPAWAKASSKPSYSWTEITNKPTIPTKTSDLTNDGSDGTSTYVEADQLAAVATSGSYNDLSNRPTVPEIKRRVDATTVADVSPLYVAGDGTTTLPMALKTHGDDHTGSFSYININEPTNAITEAYAGGYVWDEYESWWRKMSEVRLALYSDIPTVPTVNDATLTIQRNGTNVQTFTANASSNVTADISVPTKTSDLTNDGSDNTAQYLETDETAYRTTSIPYGACDNTSTATAFTATVPGITELRDGVCMLLKNGVVTSASGFTINVNGLGAKPAYSNMAAATRETTAFNINYTIMFVYDSDRVEGGCWVYYRGYYSDSNSVGYQLRTNSSTLPAKEKGYRYRLWLTSADGQGYVPINTATGTSTTSTKALNTTTPIDPFGTIVYNSTNGTVDADANLPNGTQWTQYVLDMRYQKYPLTLTFPDPVYLQCTPQSTGGALINDIVQALPSTEDGKIYIYLGNAYSATNMELKQNHPVYYYKDGAIRLWTNDAASINSVTWGDITGTLSDQTDLNTALGAKANSADLATVATSGDYDDLTDKPTIGNATLTIQKNGTSAGTFTANATSNKTINITVPTAAADVSALPASTKYGASIAVSINTADYKVTTTLKDQDGNTLGTAQVIDLPLESVVVNGSYDNTNKKIVLTLQNGNTIDIPVADLVAGLQSEITSSNKLSSDLVDDTNHTHKFVTAAQITKLNGIASGAEVNVQANWTESNSSSDAYIQNKPTLATVATSGSYNDLTDKPTIADENYLITVTGFSGSGGTYAFTADRTYAEIEAAYQAGKHLIICADIYRVPDSGYSSTTHEYLYAELSHVGDSGDSNGPTFVFIATTASGSGRSITIWSHNFYIYGNTNNPYNTYSVDNASITVTDIISNSQNPISSNAVYSALATKANSADLAAVATSGSYNDLANKPTIPAAQVNSDWNSNSGVSQILNKPSLATVATSGSYNDLSNKPTIPAAQVNSDWNASSGVAQILNKPTLATVATSGSYNDLSNKPTIPTVNNATLTIQKNGTNVQTFTANQGTNATANITVPTKTSDLTNDSGFLDSVAWGDVTGKPTFATVATSGSYNDLSNKPTIPAAQVQANWTQTTTTAVDYIKNKPALSTVATSGSYNDLSNKPTIPTVNNATLTIQKNGATVKTFTANASSNVTANITVPTATSDLTNDSGFIDEVSTITNTRIDEIMGVA